jgi:general secretion pathway protein G
MARPTAIGERARFAGFTLIELLVVLAIMASLLAIVAPRYFQRVDSAKEVVLRQNIQGLREVLDKYRADTGKSPEVLDELVQRHYLREIPLDPITLRRDTWQTVRREGEAGIRDVHSGAEGNGIDGTPYRNW